MPGPPRKVGSVRWNRELRKKQKFAGMSGACRNTQKGSPERVQTTPESLPTCPKCLPHPVQQAWSELVMDAIAAGIPVRQFDARGFVVAAGQEVDLLSLESWGYDDSAPIEQRLAVMSRKEQIRRSYLRTLVEIGGTALVRLRARIDPDEKKPAGYNPWDEI